MLETGKYGTVLELAQALKTDRSAVARRLALVNLAPDIVTAVFNGTAPETLNMAKLANGVPDKYAMKRLGQSSPNMIKDVYQHLYADKEREIAESLKNKFSDIYATKYDTNIKK